MKDFSRSDLSFSLCGLNCALCTMQLDGYCPGCGGGSGNQSCSIAKCSLAHGGYDTCFECEEYPCAKYENCTESDSFITHRNQLSDMKRFHELGACAYHAELSAKANALKFLLEHCNDGRRKSFFCLAVNLVSLSDLASVMEAVEREIEPDMPLKTKATVAVEHFEEIAAQKGIVLKLKKPPRKSV